MAEELPPINNEILREQKLTTNALASVIVEVRKQGTNERNSLNKQEVRGESMFSLKKVIIVLC